jgi:hypothetical protein
MKSRAEARIAVEADENGVAAVSREVIGCQGTYLQVIRSGAVAGVQVLPRDTHVRQLAPSFVTYLHRQGIDG